VDSEDELESVDPFGVDGDGEADGGEEGVVIEASTAVVVNGLPGREAARARGRALGLDETRLRGETGRVRDDRVARAVRYAEMEFDGRLGRRFAMTPGGRTGLVTGRLPSPFRPDPKVKKNPS
jgi:hypothetical protein